MGHLPEPDLHDNTGINTHGFGDVINITPLVVQLLLHSPKQIFFTLKSALEAEVLELFFPKQDFQYVFMQSNYQHCQLIALLKYLRQLRHLRPEVVLSLLRKPSTRDSLTSPIISSETRLGNEPSLMPRKELHC